MQLNLKLESSMDLIFEKDRFWGEFYAHNENDLIFVSSELIDNNLSRNAKILKGEG